MIFLKVKLRIHSYLIMYEKENINIQFINRIELKKERKQLKGITKSYFSLFLVCFTFILCDSGISWTYL